jgi:uncharacterized protein YcbX
MPSVTRLSVTPVKSMHLSHPGEVRLETFGVLENRRFYVAQPDGTLFNNSKHGPLVRIRATYDPGSEHLALVFPDGRVLEGDAAAVDGPVDTNFFGRWAGGHVLAGRWSDALSEYAGTPLVLVRCEHPGDASDSAPVSLYSKESAAELDRRSGRIDPHDRRRWRMLVEVEGVDPHGEDSWAGCRVRLGAAVIRVLRPVGRCVITTQDPETGIKDFDTLSAITAYRGLRDGKSIDFGVYADVEAPGTVRVGDPVEVLGH